MVHINCLTANLRPHELVRKLFEIHENKALYSMFTLPESYFESRYDTLLKKGTGNLNQSVDSTRCSITWF